MVALRLGGRRLLAPEVVQSSSMDCGPATLKCLLEGHGIRVSYGRLREACQTDVDGTSINTLEDLASQLGLNAQQIMMPVDHLLLNPASSLPAIVVVKLPSGANHFVVLWRSHAGMVQLMDPATGRQWPAREQFLRTIHQHTHPVPADVWRQWAETDEFLTPLRIRLRRLGISPSVRKRLIGDALSDPSWRSIAALDAAVRMVTAMTSEKGVQCGSEAERVLVSLLRIGHGTDESDRPLIPLSFWSVTRSRLSDEDGEQLILRGAVLVRTRGKRRDQVRKHRRRTVDDDTRAEEKMTVGQADAERASAGPSRLSPELEAAIREPSPRPLRDLFRMMREDGLLAPAVICSAMLLAAVVVLVEALLFRGLLDAGRSLGLMEQRAGGMALLLLFMAGALMLELPIIKGILRIGRLLETRLRMAFLRKLPRLTDRYFQSRLSSDMAERSHSVHALRMLPTLGMHLLRAGFALCLTTAGIIWLDPGSAPIAVAAAVLVVVVPLAMMPILNERNLRVRTHGGAMSRFYLDALIGLIPIRTHGAERPVRREHEGLLAEWMRARLSLQRSVVGVEGVQMLIGFGLAAWLLMDHFGRLGESAAVLLLIYWALNLPTYGQEIAGHIRQYPNKRSVALRLTEPLGAPEDHTSPVPTTITRARIHDGSESDAGASPCRVAMQDVAVKAAGHEILRDVNLSIEPGEHVAIVGPSGAGKSTLAGLLLGWHRPAEGALTVDGSPLDGARLTQLRRNTMWVDPTVQLWNRSLFENLRYGNDGQAMHRIGWSIAQTDLQRLLADLPQGMATPLGESGALVSGGEGQRVRLARAMLRRHARLVILDEPFRGLDREQRRTLLRRARELWRDCTLFCVTHDVEQTKDFDKVVIVEDGRIVEQGPPRELEAAGASRYHRYLLAEDEVRTQLWKSAQWRRWFLADGGIDELTSNRETAGAEEGRLRS